MTKYTPRIDVPCGKCHAPAGRKCRNYLGKNKGLCPGRGEAADTPAPVEPKQGELFPAQDEPPAPGWTKVKKSWPGIWQHSTGWLIRHCGHPTAIFPYELLNGRGLRILAPNGYAFMHLTSAQWAAEKIMREGDTATEKVDGETRLKHTPEWIAHVESWRRPGS